MVFKQSNYFQNSIDKIRHSSRNKIIKRKAMDFILQINVFVMLILPTLFYIIENYKMYDHDVTDLQNRKPEIPINETARF
uniref:Uncharacterized protein n=1 Tax=Panagrolaimus sp. PS1159 TaxID=55785 RepID=A0AC35GI53_9BILA